MVSAMKAWLRPGNKNGWCRAFENGCLEVSGQRVFAGNHREVVRVKWKTATRFETDALKPSARIIVMAAFSHYTYSTSSSFVFSGRFDVFQSCHHWNSEDLLLQFRQSTFQ